MLSLGGIIGITLSVVVFILCIGALLIICMCVLARRRQTQVLHHSSLPAGSAQYYGGGMPASEFGQSRVAYPRIWSNTHKYKVVEQSKHVLLAL